jgi:hypothetical protein
MAKINVIGRPETHTAAYKLFHYNRMWLFPTSATLDSLQLKQYEAYGYDDPEMNEIVANEFVNYNCTIAEATKKVAEGVPFGVIRSEVAIEAYKIIMEHLHDWHEYLLDHVHGSGHNPLAGDIYIPIQGLKEFNQMAMTLFDYGKRFGLCDKMRVKRSKNNRGFDPVTRKNARPHGKEVHSNNLINRITEYYNKINRAKSNYRLSDERGAGSHPSTGNDEVDNDRPI